MQIIAEHFNLSSFVNTRGRGTKLNVGIQI